MGQNSSNMGNSGGTASPRKSKPPRPSEPPKLPKIPNYVVPENKVIPNGVGDMESARKLLRPVSQELTKFHPDYADIFQYDPEDDFLAGCGGDDSSLERSLERQTGDKENSTPGMSTTSSQLSGFSNQVSHTPDPYAKTNGSVPNGTANIASRSVGDLTENKTKDSSLKRTHSLEKDRSNQPRVMGHKRQASLTNGISPSQQPVILEDPREHLYNVTRQQPFSNLIPANASLPLKNSFDSDYSLNLTYAQLAEYRRQQRNADLESKTGQKLKDLGVEIDANNIVPKSPFDRSNLGAKSKSSAHSVSTASSEVGVSKSKKKKAAPPPPPPPPEKEPPADYDMQDVSSNLPPSLQRQTSSSSGNSKAPLPDPDPNSRRTPTAATSRLERNQMAMRSATGGLDLDQSASPAGVSPPPPPPPPAPPLPAGGIFTKSSTNTNNNEEITKPENKSNKIPGQSSLNKSMSDAKAQLEMLKQMAAMLKAPKQETAAAIKEGNKDRESDVEVNAPEENISEPVVSVGTQNLSDVNNNPTGNDVNVTVASDVTANGNASEDKENFSIPLSGDTPSDETKDSPRSQLKRMNSLLQYDIILAAKAQGAKQKKTKTPPTYEKPKDPAQVFREELQKAAQAREERRKEVKENSKESVNVSNTNDTTSTEPDDDAVYSTNQRQRQRLSSIFSNEPIQSATERSLSKVVPDLTPIGQNGITSSRSSASFEDMSISSNNSQRVYSSNWTPEEDLEPDDDILQERNVNDKQSAESQGFKSSIVPMKLKDLKEKKEKKPKKNVFEKQKSQKEAHDVSQNGENSKNKFGSIRRFKKTVHDNVKTAFGSISKASGKLLKKNKSQDFLSMVPDKSLRPVSHSFAPGLDSSDNWELVEDGETSLRRSRSAEFIQHPNINGHDDYFDEESDEHSHSEAEIDDIDFASGIDTDPKSKKKITNGKMSASENRKMKRAGVAYVNSTGQIIVLPEYNTVAVDAEGNEVGKTKDDESRAPKLFRKKDKKLKYESTVRMQERNRREEIITREIREKENQIERERLRQQEIERDFRRLRDLDTQERLQRMQTDNILQQLTFLQQQQVRQAHLDLNNGHSLHNTPQAPLLNGGPSIPNQPNSLLSRPNVPQHQSYPHIPESSLPTHISHPTNSSSNIHNSSYLNHQPSPHIHNTPSSLNTSHFTTHSSPIIGNLPPNAPTSSNANSVPNLSVQDLNYLSGYMKMMGVAPPANQQQWAFLLSSVSFNSPNFPGGPTGNTSMNNPTNGPDLSKLFGMGKTLESTVIDSNNPNKPTFYELIHKNNTGTNNIQTNVILSQFPTTSIQENPSKLVEVETDPSATKTISSDSAEHRYTTVATESQVPSPNSSFSAEERLDALTSSGSSYNTNNDISKDSSSSQSSNTLGFHNGAKDNSKLSNPVSPRLPPKVYGPLGFKPVSFKAGAT